MWDERYDQPGYLFGTDPSQFLIARKDWLIPGHTALAVADGEGRNSVYMARQGLDVTAMDNSSVGLEKARRLATEHAVDVDYQLTELENWQWTPEHFDLVAAIFIQFASPDFRQRIFDGMIRTLKPGGVLLLHGYRPEQIEYGTGGPPIRENLYTEALLTEAFQSMDIVKLESYDLEIKEGDGHAGMSALIDLVARKP